MAWGWGRLTCVDIIEDRIAAIEVERGWVRRWAVRALRPGLLVNGTPPDPRALGSEVRTALDEGGISSRRAFMTISDRSVVVRYVDLPRMRRGDLRRALGFVVERALPLPAAGAAIDWDLVPTEGGGVTVCVAAAWRDVVDQVAGVATAAGLKCSVIEPRGLAVARALNGRGGLVLDLASTTLSLTAVRKGFPPLVEVVSVGGDEGGVAAGVAQLLERFRQRAPSAESALPLIAAGHLASEAAGIRIPSVGVNEVLNGARPHRPPRFWAAHHLAAIGLAMREQR